MNQRKRTSVVKKALAMSLVLALLLSSGTTVFAGKTLAEDINFQEQVKLDDVLYNNNYFTDYLAKTEGEFTDVAQGTKIEVDVNGYSAFEGEQPVTKSLEGKDNVLYISNDNKSVSWEIEVETPGYYQFNTEYLPVDGNGLAVTRGILIDGEYLYDELVNIKLVRHWVDSEKPRVNNLGDEVRPSQQENQEWTKTELYDAQGEYYVPLKVGLTAGKHTITLVYVDQPLALASFTLTAPNKIPTYAELSKSYKNMGYKSSTKPVRIEAENKDNVLYKSDSGVTIANSNDPTVTPAGVTSRKYNGIGAGSWGSGNQEIAWKIKVEEDGLYKIATRIYQAYGNGLSSTRQIKIDGMVPFQEFNNYIFTYDEEWRTETLADKDGNPYEVYLTKGEHIISMRVVMGQMTEVIHIVTDITSKLSNAIRNITMITGQTPDLNYDYRLTRQIPSLMGDLKAIKDELVESNEKIGKFANKKTPIQNNFEMNIELIEKLMKKPSKIPANLAELSSSLTNIGTWLNDIKKQSLSIDYISFVPVDAEVKNERKTIWDTLYALFANFILSYQKDYNAIGFVGDGFEDFETIEVWVSRGKEWCEILKDMIDSNFAPNHKINVDINILPANTLTGGSSPLLLAINAGTEPDVVIGITSDIPIEYSIRGAMYNLKKFDDFEEVKKRFLAENFTPLTYEGGTYAVPETMSFTTMFYRADIFKQLDLKVPNTWDDVRDNLLPQLYQYNMEMYMPNTPHMMIFQNQGEIYSETGYSSKLDSPNTMKGMEALIELYTEYGCPVSANFLNRFRSGEMPIGISSMDFYLQLIYAAPELTGKWEMVPIPGTVQADGSIDRTVGGSLATCMSILSTTEHPEASWEFVKWYTSAETQAAYGRQVESILGIQSRWATSNLEAFKQLPWSKEEIGVIEASWKWVKGVPAVLGGYYTNRNLTNAYNRCVIEGQSVRESMEEAAEQVNLELKRKQEMYGVNPEGLK